MPEPYPPHVDRLRTISAVDFAAPWPDYPATYDLTRADVDDLLRMTRDPALADAPDPDAWAALHAWRALGQLGAPAAAAPLLGLVERNPDNDWIREEIPRALGLLGAPAIPAIRAVVEDTARDVLDRANAVEALRHVVRHDPAARDEVVALLVEVLGRPDTDQELAGFVVGILMDLRAVEAAPAIEAAFAAHRVDDSIPGDWEDVQIGLGLLEARRTARPNYARGVPGHRPPFEATDRRAERRAQVTHHAQDRAKAKAKRKAATRARQANRRKGR